MSVCFSVAFCKFLLNFERFLCKYDRVGLEPVDVCFCGEPLMYSSVAMTYRVVSRSSSRVVASSLRFFLSIEPETFVVLFSKSASHWRPPHDTSCVENLASVQALHHNDASLLLRLIGVVWPGYRANRGKVSGWGARKWVASVVWRRHLKRKNFPLNPHFYSLLPTTTTTATATAAAGVAPNSIQLSAFVGLCLRQASSLMAGHLSRDLLLLCLAMQKLEKRYHC